MAISMPKRVTPAGRLWALQGGAHSASTETWHLDASVASVFIHAADLGRRRALGKGARLYTQGQIGRAFYFVLTGRFQVSMFQRDGTEFVLEVMGRWSVCGEGSAIAGYPHIATAIALEDSEVIEFDYAYLRAAIGSFPDLALALLHTVSVKQHVLGTRIQFMAMPKPELRIGELLRRLADLYGRPESGKMLIPIPLTHEQIAAMTGTSRVTVTRALLRLKQDGVIEMRGRRFCVVDRTKLCG